MKLFIARAIEKWPLYWQLSTLRSFLYMGIVGWGAFMAGTEGYDTLSGMTWLQLIKLFGGVSATMLGVLLAFLDQTITKISGQKPTTDDNLAVVKTSVETTVSQKPEP